MSNADILNPSFKGRQSMSMNLKKNTLINFTMIWIGGLSPCICEVNTIQMTTEAQAEVRDKLCNDFPGSQKLKGRNRLLCPPPRAEPLHSHTQRTPIAITQKFCIIGFEVRNINTCYETCVVFI